ncbi:ribosomal-protein-alanine N-acetyltransferase [Serratia ficaria]|uniref:GNAT family N-acetyltransferase n=1 Tax=Serratia ficaria TaxID=61651 RepID=UPI002182C88E|nr:GNAT family N-acetyltransferase [Serratia ficaria]CAI2455118.1 ribosomal-protein-alanine N-acetyltransferase [Serratia ficaria]
MNSISTLTAADLATAFKIERASHAFPWTEATFASNQGDRYLNLKLNADGQMAGFAITQIVLDEATLFNIAIHPDWQRRGFGRTLLNALIALYEDLGFNEVTLRRNYYPSANGREDAIVMALPLA